MEQGTGGCGRAHQLLGGQADFTIPGAESNYPPDLELEPKHLDIALTFSVPERSAAGRVVTTVVANREGARKLALKASDFEEVDVTDADGRPLTWKYDGRDLEILWQEPFQRDEERKLAVDYRVDHPVSGLHFAAPDEQYPDRAEWIASDHETERARHWLPCVDYPAVRTTLSFHLTAKESYTILANGLLTSEESNGDGTKTAHWDLDYPCPSYLLCIALGDFVRADDRPVGGREIAYFGARGRATEENLMRSFGRTPEIMEWLQERVGNPFPFKKYFQFGLPAYGGAMENISLVSWDDMFIVDETLGKDIGELVDIINVHEMAHSYFGDAVVIRDYAHAWLKESWATYTEACWYEHAYGDDAFRYDLFSNARAYFMEADQNYRRPIVTRVFNSSWDMYDRHLYPGGSWRIYMLRRMLGDDVFWPAVADYLATYSKKTVETEDFRQKLEAHSGRSLVRFFDQWVFGVGYPKLEVKFAHDTEKKQGTFSLTQTQAGEKGDKGVGAFHFPLTIAWETADGGWESREVEVEREKQDFLFPMDEAPQQVRVDPEGSILFSISMNPGDKMLRRAVKHGPDIVARILAAEELVKTGKRKNFDAVAAAFSEEPFWGVRDQMAKMVAKSKSAFAVDLLAGWLNTEEDPRVRMAIAAGSGDYRDARIEAALVECLDRDPTYYVASAALVSLGRQGGEAHLDRLGAAADQVDYRGLVRSGALRALAATRSEAALEDLKGRCGYGAEPDDAAPAHAGAYASCAWFLERRHRDQAVDDLILGCRDPRERVRKAAIQALGSLGDARAIPAIEAAIKTFAEQDGPRTRRTIMAIRSKAGGTSGVAALRKDLEKLEEKNRKLEARIDRLTVEREAELEGILNRSRTGSRLLGEVENEQTSTAVTLDALLAHGGWVRKVALALTGDPSRAEDLMQQVWLKAVRNPPRLKRSPKGWLGSALRTTAVDMHRAERRRTRHEGAAARPGERPATDLLEQTEVRKRVALAVLSLPEHYREVILLRYFDDLSAGEVSVRLQIPVETVRTRTRRALHRLRRTLGGVEPVPRVFGLPLFRVASPALSSGGLVMTMKLKIAVAAAVLALLSVSAWTVLDGPDDEMAPEKAEAPPVERIVDSKEPETLPDSTYQAALAAAFGRGGGTPVPAKKYTEPEDFEPGPGRIVGKIVGPDGKPIVGAVVKVPSQMGFRLGNWKDPQAQTDSQGRFRLDTGSQGLVQLQVRAPGYVVVTPKVTPGGELLSLALVEAFPLAGLVTDEQTGEPIIGVVIQARPAASPTAGDSFTAVSGPGGKFAFDGLPKGKWKLNAGLYYRVGEMQGNDYIEKSLENIASGTIDVALKLVRGLSISGSLFDGGGSPVTTLVHVEVIGLTKDGRRDYTRRRLVPVYGGKSFVVPGLPDGDYDLTFTPDASGGDLDISATVLKAIPAGSEHLSVRMMSGSKISGVLINDAEEPVTTGGYIYVYPSGKSAGVPGSVMGKLGKDGRFTTPALDEAKSYDVLAHGFAGHRSEKVKGVLPGASEVTIVLTRALSITGRVFNEEGKPVAGGVGVMAVAAKLDPGEPGAVVAHVTQQDGSFTIDGLVDAEYRVTAGGASGGYRPDEVLTGVRPGKTEVRLTVKLGAVLTGRLVDESGLPVRTHLIRASGVGVVGVAATWTGVEGDDGRFTLRGLPTGKVTINAYIGDKFVELGVFEAPAENLELVVPADDD